MRTTNGVPIRALAVLNTALGASQAWPLTILFEPGDGPADAVIRHLRQRAADQAVDLWVESDGSDSMTLWAVRGEPIGDRVRRAMDQPTGF